jgi:hypothetical protein
VADPEAPLAGALVAVVVQTAVRIACSMTDVTIAIAAMAEEDVIAAMVHALGVAKLSLQNCGVPLKKATRLWCSSF